MFGHRQAVLHARLSTVQILTPELGMNRATVWPRSSSCLAWLSEDLGGKSDSIIAERRQAWGRLKRKLLGEDLHQAMW